MPADFHVSGLEIDCFRGTRSLSLGFLERTPTYLIGANNSGKSTALRAIALALRGGGFAKFSPGPFDFFRDAAGTHADQFQIHLAFAADEEAKLPQVQAVGTPQAVHGLTVHGNIDDSGRHTHRHQLRDREGDPILLTPATPLKEPDKQRFRGRGLGAQRRYARFDDISRDLPEVWLLQPSNLEASLYIWRTGPLHRLASLLSRRFLTTEWTYSFGGHDQPMPATMLRFHDFFHQVVNEFPFWKDDLRPRLEQTIGLYLGRQAGMMLRPAVQQVEEWLAQQVLASLAADAGGAVTPLACMGDGWQSLVRLACLDVLRQYPGESRDRVVLLYEEPETYLHPHLRRKLRDVLDGLADLGWLVVASTHAPELISFTRKQQIVRLWRDAEIVSMGTLQTARLSAIAKYQELIDEHGNHEMLFASRVILVEGKDDECALRHYFRLRGVDLDGGSISILDVHGVRNQPLYAGISDELGILWCALSDEDRDAETGVIQPTTEGAREQLRNLCGSRNLVPVWTVNLETCLGVPPGEKAKPAWQLKHLAPKTLVDIQREHPEFARTCEAIIAWILGTPSPAEPSRTEEEVG
jgi:predicted ATPase